jgi:hypothetical protein
MNRIRMMLRCFSRQKKVTPMMSDVMEQKRQKKMMSQKSRQKREGVTAR